MITIIAGSRHLGGFAMIERAVKLSGFEITKVISGGARGVDRGAIEWAKQHNIPFKVMNADWDLHGNSAGIIRNIEMAKEAQALVAIWDGSSRGTAHMIDEATRRGLKVYVYRVG